MRNDEQKEKNLTVCKRVNRTSNTAHRPQSKGLLQYIYIFFQRLLLSLFMSTYFICICLLINDKCIFNAACEVCRCVCVCVFFIYKSKYSIYCVWHITVESPAKDCDHERISSINSRCVAVSLCQCLI